MQFATILSAASLATFASLSNAHMLLNKPQAFPSGDKPSNGPLNGPGSGPSNYPCKQQPDGSTYKFDFPRTQMPIGSNYSVQFKGGATHGGGSCQFSLTKDLAPSAGTDFKVIHSVVGGCPARNQNGNAGENAGAMDADQYSFQIPEGLDPGDYTFAWTWFNKIGNREFYMNCAPVTLAGGGGGGTPAPAPGKRDVEVEHYNTTLVKRDPLDSYPNLLLGNIPDVKCTSKDSANVQFPNPGQSVEINDKSPAPLVGDANQCYAPVGKMAGAGGQGSGGNSNVAAPAPAGGSSTPASNAPARPSPAASSPAQFPTPAADSAASPSPIATPGTPPPTGSSPGNCPAGAQPCSNQGAVVCIGNNQFGLCDQTGCAVPQPLAAGTTCQNGAIARRSAKFHHHPLAHAKFHSGHI